MKFHRQFTRYALVGLVSNTMFFAAYLLLTHVGMGSKFAMTLMFCLGTFFTFIFNKAWTFGFDGGMTLALRRYLAAYALGYGINLLALLVFVDIAGFAHQTVQGLMVLVVAMMLFIAQRYWVFPLGTKRGMK